MEVEPIFEAEYFLSGVNEGLMVGDGDGAPVRFMGPGSQVAQNLTLAAALLTPEENASVGPLESLVLNTTNIHWTPMVSAVLLVSLQVHLVPDNFARLKLRESCR